jgi:hypothetical protein
VITHAACLMLALLPAAHPAQAEKGWSVGAQLHLAAPLGGGASSLREDLQAHLGSGMGLSLGYRVADPHEFRAALDFLGTRSTAHSGEGRNLNDIWRTLRLGVEHVLYFEEAYVFYGGGVQEAWVNRTEGSLGEATFLVTLYALGAGSGSVHYSVHGTELDSRSGFATAGLGLPLGRTSSAELRWIGAPYLRYTTEGLRTIGPAPTERRLGHQAVFSLRFRMR